MTLALHTPTAARPFSSIQAHPKMTYGHILPNGKHCGHNHGEPRQTVDLNARTSDQFNAIAESAAAQPELEQIKQKPLPERIMSWITGIPTAIATSVKKLWQSLTKDIKAIFSSTSKPTASTEPSNHTSSKPIEA